MDKEIRSIANSEFRISPNSRKIEGYALNFNVLSDNMGGFQEVISPSAVDGVIEISDVLATYQHNEDQVLARSTNGVGTLSLKVDKNGLLYSFDAPNSTLGDTLIESIKRGDIRNSSFAFTVASDGQKWEKRSDGTYLRTITKFNELFDVACVARPAYNSTTVALRSLESIKNQNMEMEEREMIKVEVEVEICDDNMMDIPDVTDPTAVMDPTMPMDPSMPVEPVVPEEMIDIVYDGNTYTIPKSLIEDYLPQEDPQLNEYLNQLENDVETLKKQCN